MEQDLTLLDGTRENPTPAQTELANFFANFAVKEFTKGSPEYNLAAKLSNNELITEEDLSAIE